MKKQCFLYETRSGWHWEVDGLHWNLSDRKNLETKGYGSRSSARKAAEKICKAFGFEFEVFV